jgi:ABC-type transport system involved in multi-copper enzyme maturation permease subunit
MNLLDTFWSIFVFFLLVAWIWVVIGVISDVFRSRDLSGLSKGIWVMFIIVIPWLGVLSYVVIRGKGMQERNMQAVADAGERQRAYIQSVAGTSTADELSKLAELKDKGVITDSEFEAQKARLLN